MAEIPAAPYTGYVDGGDFLLELAGKCVGHCTEHSLSYTSETKDRQVKAAKTVTALGSSKWKDSVVTGLSISGSASGYIYSREEEMDIDALRQAWRAGKPLNAKGYRRDENTDSYVEVPILITKLDEKYPKGDDATWSIDFINAGAPTKFSGD